MEDPKLATNGFEEEEEEEEDDEDEEEDDEMEEEEDGEEEEEDEDDDESEEEEEEEEEEDEDDQSVSMKDITKEKIPVKHQDKSSSTRIRQYTGRGVHNMPRKSGGHVRSFISAKKISTVIFTQESVKNSNKKFIKIWKKHEKQRNSIDKAFSKKFTNVFLQWDFDVQKLEKQQGKLAKKIKRQQHVFQRSRTDPSESLMDIKVLHERFAKGFWNLEYHNPLISGSQSKLKKEIFMFKKKIMKDTLNYISNSKAKHQWKN